MLNRLKNLKDTGKKLLDEKTENSIEELTEKTLSFFKDNMDKANKAVEAKLGINLEESIRNAERDDAFRVIHAIAPFPINLIPEEKFLKICNDQSDKILNLVNPNKKPDDENLPA